MQTIDQAFEHYAREISPLPVVEMSIRDALGRVLAEEVRSPLDLPPYPQSAMDGYALRAEDCERASPEHPVRLRLVGEIPAGRVSSIPQLQAGEAMRIFTGGYLPQGADAILRQEDAQIAQGHLFVYRPLPVGADLRKQGEEIPKGERLALAGTRLAPGHLAALAIAGVDRVRVYREPHITILTTGDEVIPPGRPLERGQVYDANTPMIMSWLRAHGYTHIHSMHLPDDLQGTEEALREALAQSDLVISAGGVSVGERDFVTAAAHKLGVREVFWRVKQKPGKPLFFGMFSKKSLLGLPGNPGAVFVCLITHVRRVLDMMEGASPAQPIFFVGRLRASLEPAPAQERWVRCRLECSPRGEIELVPLPHQASHMITNLAECTALVRLPPGSNPLPPNSLVSWTPVRIL